MNIDLITTNNKEITNNNLGEQELLNLMKKNSDKNA